MVISVISLITPGPSAVSFIRLSVGMAAFITERRISNLRKDNCEAL